MLLLYEQISTKALWYLCWHFYQLVYITEPDSLPFLKSSSAQKRKKTKICKSEYRAGNITQRFCKATELCIISVKIYAVIMVKVTSEIKGSILVWITYKKVSPAARVTFFFAMRVIGNKQFFKVGPTIFISYICLARIVMLMMSYLSLIIILK